MIWAQRYDSSSVVGSIFSVGILGSSCLIMRNDFESINILYNLVLVSPLIIEHSSYTTYACPLCLMNITIFRKIAHVWFICNFSSSCYYLGFKYLMSPLMCLLYAHNTLILK